MIRRATKRPAVAAFGSFSIILLPSLLEAVSSRRIQSTSCAQVDLLAPPLLAFAASDNHTCSGGSSNRSIFGRRSLSTISSSSSSRMSMSAESRILESPSAERNKDPILSVLRTDGLRELGLLPTSNSPLKVLEVAAGCGVHTVHFARGLGEEILCAGEEVAAAVQWYPTDPSPSSRGSIDARVAAALDDGVSGSTLSTLRGGIVAARSLTLDADGVMEGRGGGGGGIKGLPNPIADLSDATIDLVININMIHISPWEATIGLMKLSSKLLRKGGILYCYGPYKVNGTAVQSNLNFDASLKSRDASWGVRNLEDVVEEAERHGLKLIKTIEMPANNLSVLYQKQ